MEPREYKQFQSLAEARGLSLGEWVRQTLRRFALSASAKGPQAKINSIRRASQLHYPSGEMEQILADIEKGYLE